MLTPEYLASFPDYIVTLFEQSDAWLIKHIHHIGKRRIDVTRDLDTLRLAAGESVCSTA